MALLASGVAGEPLGTWPLVGIGLVCGGIGSVALPLPAGRALPLALATGAAIATYTTIDGLGARVAARPLEYIAWQFVVSQVPFAASVCWLRRRRLRRFLREEGRGAFAAGALAAVGYGVVMWAMTRGGLAHVSALRETSVVLATLIGTRWLGEPLATRRIGAAVAVAVGVVLLQSA